MTRRIFLLTDSHFGHRKLIDIGDRPQDFEERILTKLRMMIKDEDIVIHLGDFSMTNTANDVFWHRKFMQACGNARKYLIKGNHDNRSDTWYLEHGWDLVTHGMVMKVNGKFALLSHKPSMLRIGSHNIHGHTHGNAHRDDEAVGFYDPTYHIEVAMEKKPLYEPRLLSNIIK